MNIKIYQSGLKFMFCNALKRLYNDEVVFHHSLDKGIYATISGNTIIDKEKLEHVKEHMKKMSASGIPFNKKVIDSKEAYSFYMKKNQLEKAININNIDNLTVSLFELEGQHNYFYSHDMPKTTKEIDLFDLYYIKDNEVVLIYPTDGELVFEFRNKIYQSFQQYNEWLRKLHLKYVSDVNKIIAEGCIEELIRKNDIMVDNQLYDIARNIVNANKRIVLLAGPSSSGKTTSSKKLSLYLASLGYNAYPISLDDFFLNRDQTPLDEEGNRDYECLEALDLELFNNTLNSLLKGEEVKLPRFNFISGEKEFITDPVSVLETDILVIEGLHSINPNLIKSDIKDLCYKVYISPLTPLNVDRHNYVSTTDNRLLRRIIRDFRTRGRSCEASLATWASVRRGEEKHIFPYTDTVDDILNTAYVYELGVLKTYVEPLLYSIDFDSEFYYEARRLLDNLKAFYSIPSEYVSGDNLLREFIGGSNFEE